jgi:hypothetical protein
LIILDHYKHSNLRKARELIRSNLNQEGLRELDTYYLKQNGKERVK